ncbi:MAG: hypothetical protein JKY89_07345 [Immundisolibacteraceae bacterium]|nr:hypothetical protein [Immundisolibacteraceae bacterium]
MKRSAASLLRLFILLLILLMVALQQFGSRMRTSSWETPLWAVIYPINADGSEAAQQFIADIAESDFDAIEGFLAEEAEVFGLPLSNPIAIKLAPEITSLPPVPPSGGTLAIIWWSLKTRWWSSVEDTFEGPSADIQLFVLYHDPEIQSSLRHSVGIRNGGYALINAFADNNQRGSNQVIIAHELMHTLGATDKYLPTNGQPVYPAGYAKPDQLPLHPQHFAELMAGRIPLSADTAKIPENLDEVLIGRQSAIEIRWLK